MKTWGEMTKEEKLEILSALLDGKFVEAYSVKYQNEKLVRCWHETWINFFYDDIPVRIKT